MNTAKKFLFIVILMLLAAPKVFPAQESHETLKSDAEVNAKIGVKLVKEANEIMWGKVNRYTAKTALNLYVEAGKLFEKSRARYKVLYPHYATQDEVDNVDKAMRYCLEMAKTARKYIK